MFFANSGTEAVEGAIKLARRWAGEHKPGAYKVVSLERSFHGRTLAALAATGQASKQEAFAPMPEGFVHVRAQRHRGAGRCGGRQRSRRFCSRWCRERAACGRSSAEYLAAARSICDAHGCLLMIDEIQTGFFRTGPAFAHQAFDITPDVITVAKALANGLPIGGIVARDEVAAALKPGDHGSTFGGGPVDLRSGSRHDRCARRRGPRSQRRRESASTCRPASERSPSGPGPSPMSAGPVSWLASRSLGPIAADVGAMALERGIVVNTIGTDILRFLPPLVCGKPEIDTLLSTLSDILGESGLAYA